MTPNSTIVLFDGVCNLCNGSVQFIIKRDKNGMFKFASLQSAFAKDQLEKFGLPGDALYSIIVLKEDKLYQRSDAVIEILKELGGFGFLCSICKIVPRTFRDVVYNLISKNRYRIFGRKDQCMIPKPEWKERFIDG